MNLKYYQHLQELKWSVSVARNPKQVYPYTRILWYRGARRTRIRTNGQPGFFLVVRVCLEHYWQSSLNLSLHGGSIIPFSKERSKPRLFCNLPVETWTANATFMMLQLATPASMDRAREKHATSQGPDANLCCTWGHHKIW